MRLDLSGRGLTSAQFADLPLPPVEQLEELDLSHNRLSWLPDGIGGFTSLRVLRLQDNEIVFVHDNLWRVTRLETLDLSNNRIDHLGEGVGRLTALRELNLAHNQLRKLPASLDGLTSLRLLDLRGNGIETTPALRELEAAGCLVYL